MLFLIQTSTIVLNKQIIIYECATELIFIRSNHII